MQLVISDEEHAVLETAVNGAQSYGIATIAEMGVEDTNKIRIVVPSNAELRAITTSNSLLQDTKLHHILCAAIARNAKKDVHNTAIKLRGDNLLPPLLIQGAKANRPVPDGGDLSLMDMSSEMLLWDIKNATIVMFCAAHLSMPDKGYNLSVLTNSTLV
eukprot:GHVP01036722.1.p1 GENE.GHVP01036722.1~~GHVP01036722.1.p1  ORF type:complete len:159 (+),score=7.94 GHVP01036722.1:287-763(+)